ARPRVTRQMAASIGVIVGAVVRIAHPAAWPGTGLRARGRMVRRPVVTAGSPISAVVAGVVSRGAIARVPARIVSRSAIAGVAAGLLLVAGFVGRFVPGV